LAAQCPDGLGGIVPGDARIAAQVDDVSPRGAIGPGLGDNLRPRQPRTMIDLGQDLDVVAAARRLRTCGLLASEQGWQVAQVVRTPLDRYAGFGCDDGQVAGAQARQDDTVYPGRYTQMAGDPGSRRQGGDGDGQHSHTEVEAGSRCQVGQDPLQGRLGQLA